MSEDMAASQNIAELAAEIVAAYVSNNSISTTDLPGLISSVYASIAGLGSPAATPEAAKPVPLVSIKKSITPDYLISLEDGKRYKSLKRHLGKHGLTPTEYRTKWGLPQDYPMVAPNYSAQRSEMAKSLGLGRKRAEAAERARAEAAASTKPRGRRKAA